MVWPICTKFGTTVKKFEFQKSKMADGRHYENHWIAIYRKCLTDFDEIWHGDTHWPLTSDRPLKFRIFENPRWWWPPSWKSQNLDISATVWPIFKKFGRWCKMGLLTAQTVKNFNFKNPIRRMAAILKTVKSPFLCNLLTDFDEIW